MEAPQNPQNFVSAALSLPHFLQKGMMFPQKLIA
jgi:hypothetical protein